MITASQCLELAQWCKDCLKDLASQERAFLLNIARTLLRWLASWIDSSADQR